MLGLENVVEEFETMDTESLIRVITFLGSKFVKLDDKSSVNGISNEALNSEALAGILYAAFCETCDDKGFFPAVIAGKLDTCG